MDDGLQPRQIIHKEADNPRADDVRHFNERVVVLLASDFFEETTPIFHSANNRVSLYSRFVNGILECKQNLTAQSLVQPQSLVICDPPINRVPRSLRHSATISKS